MAKESPVISWQIEEYIHREKGPDWFWALGIIALAGSAIAVIYHDVLFAIFIVISAIILGFYAARRPEVISIAVSDEGVKIRSYLYPYAKLKGFAITAHDLGYNLLVESDRILTPLIAIPLPTTMDTESLSVFLKTHLEEKPLKEHASQRIMERLGF